MIFLFQQAQPGSAPPGGLGGSAFLIQMVVIIAIFYFLVFAPMRRKQRKTQELLSQLKKGDEVITNAGIFGRVAALDEQRGFVVLQIADNVKVKVLRSAIAGMATEPEAVKTPAP